MCRLQSNFLQKLRPQCEHENGFCVADGLIKIPGESGGCFESDDGDDGDKDIVEWSVVVRRWHDVRFMDVEDARVEEGEGEQEQGDEQEEEGDEQDAGDK